MSTLQKIAVSERRKKNVLNTRSLFSRFSSKSKISLNQGPYGTHNPDADLGVRTTPGEGESIYGGSGACSPGKF